MQDELAAARGAPDEDALTALGVGLLVLRADADGWSVATATDPYRASLPAAYRDEVRAGRRVASVLPPAVATALAGVAEEARRDGSGHRALVRLDFSDHDVRWQRWAASRDDDDTVSVVTLDVSEVASLRERAAVHDAERAAITDGLRDAVVLMDAARLIRYANGAAAELLGAPLVGASWMAVRDRIGFQRVDGVQRAITVERALAGFVPDPLDVRFAVAGRDVICRASVQPLRLGGDVIGAAVVLSDVTEERRLAFERKSLLARQLAVGEQVRSEVAASLHDGVLQTLAELSVMVGAAEATGRPLDPAAIAAAVDRGVEQCRRITEDLRPGRIDEGVSAALGQLVEIWQQRGLLDITAEGDTLPRLEPWRETLLYQVTAEALRNALKHARGSRVRLLQERRGDRVVVVVADDGPGATPEQRRAAAEAGHLGLVLSRERMEAAGGTYSFDSGPDGGSVVTLSLPVV